MLDVKAYTDGYCAGSSAAEYVDENEIPNPRFEESDSATYQKGWWDGFNKLEFDPGGQGLFPTLRTDPRRAVKGNETCR